MPVNEAGLVLAIVKAVKKQYPTAWILKVHGSPYQTAGVPDLLCGVDGLLVGLEVKFIHPNESRDHAIGRTTALQRVQITQINAAGGAAGTVTSAAEALDLIGRGLDRHNQREKEQG
jgi:hypothetical protein